MTVEKKVLDTHHQELRRLDMGLHQGSLSDDERLRFFRLEKQYRNEPAFKRLAMILSGVGVRRGYSFCQKISDHSRSAIFSD